MRRRRGARLTLTNRFLLLAAVIVVSTTVLLLATSAAGVYDMARRQESTRLAAYRDILLEELRSHLRTLRDATSATAENPTLGAADAGQLDATLSRLALDNAELLQGAALLDANGIVIDAWPADTLVGASTAVYETAETSLTAAVYLWDAPRLDDVQGTMWVVAPVRGEGGEQRVLLSRLRDSFLSRVLTDLSDLPGASTALVFDGDGRVVYRSEGALALEGASMEFTPDSREPSGGELMIDGDVGQSGPYAEIDALSQLGWTVAVVDPSSAAWKETQAALAPGVLGWVAALALALVTALAVVSRMTQPLKELETRATALASGSAVEVETVVEHDEVGRLIEAFNSVVRRLNRMNDISELLARASDRSLVLAGVTSAVAHMLDAVDAEVLLLGGEGQLDLVAAEGVLSGREGVTVRLADVPWIAEAITTGQPVGAPAGARDAYLDLHGPSVGAALAAPLRAASETIGVTVVVRHTDVAFTEVEVDTVRTFAAQASVALQNSRLFEDERRSRREAEALRSVAERVASPGDIETVLADVARMQADLVGSGVAHVALVDRKSYGLREPDEPADEQAWIALWRTVAGEGEDPAEPVCVDVRSVNPDAAELMRQQDVSVALLTPLYRAAGFAGVMVLSSTAPCHALSPRRLALAGTVGRQASLALENAFLYQQAKKRADDLETIFRISHAVSSSLQSRIVLNRVLDVVQKMLSADAVMLMTYDAQRKLISVPMARGILHRDMLEATFRPGEDVPGRVFETREPERYDRISTADTLLLNSAAQQGLESLLAVPLLARGRSIGVLVVFAREPAAFSTDELDLLRTFGSQAALAIDTAEMFSREHNVATVLQESILPIRLPRIPGIEASSVYLPAGTDADIGGDYYDLFTAPDGRVVVSIGDVCGKGVLAATKTSMIRYALRGMVVAGLEPARVLAELNTMLLEAGDATSIVTLWLGYIDTTTGRLLYADGGHPPGLLRRSSDARIERLATTGALLGAVPGITWTQLEVPIEDGATLLLYTDGVTEARSGDRFFGEGRVRRALRAGGSPASVAQRLLSQVQRFASGELRDDAAILAVAYVPAYEAAEGVSP
jgi:GAF domain-containing protein